MDPNESGWLREVLLKGREDVFVGFLEMAEKDLVGLEKKNNDYDYAVGLTAKLIHLARRIFVRRKEVVNNIKKELLLELISAVEKISEQTDEPVKSDFYNNWFPLIRSAVVRAEIALGKSNMPVHHTGKKEVVANHRDSGGEA